MAENKTKFLIPLNLIETFERMSDEEAGRLAKVLWRHANGRELNSPDRQTELICAPFLTDIDKDMAAWEETCKKRREAGKKSGEVRRTKRTHVSNVEQNEQVFAVLNNVEPVEQMRTDVMCYDMNIELPIGNSDLSSKSETLVSEEKKELSNLITHEENFENESKNSKKLKRSVFSPPSLQMVSDYIKEQNYSVKAYEWLNFYQSKGWMIGKNKMVDWKAAVRTWENKSKNEVNSLNNKNIGAVDKALSVQDELAERRRSNGNSGAIGG